MGNGQAIEQIIGTVGCRFKEVATSPPPIAAVDVEVPSRSSAPPCSPDTNIAAEGAQGNSVRKACTCEVAVGVTLGDDSYNSDEGTTKVDDDFLANDDLLIDDEGSDECTRTYCSIMEDLFWENSLATVTHTNKKENAEEVAAGLLMKNMIFRQPEKNV